MSEEITPEQWSRLNDAVTRYEASLQPGKPWSQEIARQHVIDVLLSLARPLTEASRPNCPTCNGTGWLDRCKPSPPPHLIDKQCDDCDRTGKVQR